MDVPVPRTPAHRFFVAILVTAAIAATASPARATFIREYPIPELWTLADCVIEAWVDSVTYGSHPTNGQIVSHIHLNVTVVHQGICVTGTRVLTQAGGRLGGSGLAIPRQPSFTPGEHVLLFLDELPGLLFPVLALDQGKFTIGAEPGGRETLRNRLYPALDRETMFGRLRPLRRDR